MSETRETIQERMLSNIGDEYDKSQGSFFYDATAPVAIELEKADSKADSIPDYGFADTATGIFLDKKANERGLTRKLATKASGIVKITGVVGSAISASKMVASDSVNYVFMESNVVPASGSINVPVQCEKYGIVGNVPVGAIKYFPETLEGLQTVTNEVAFSNGYEEETDEELRERYYTKVRTPATSGNKYHYLNWAKEVTGVGDAKIIPLWNGNGTVKVIIINSNKRAADAALITAVSEYIEENRPIGATATVVSATEKPINIIVTLVIDTQNYTIDQVKAWIETNLTNYFKSIAFVETYVSYAKIGNVIFDSPGVIDYSNLTINGGTANILIAETEVAVIGGVTVG